MDFQFDLQLFGGGGTTVNETKYEPSEYELELQKLQSDYANAVAPNALWLNDTAKDILENSIGTVQVDYDKLNADAQQQIADAQQGIRNIIGSNVQVTNAGNSMLGEYKPQYGQVASQANRALASYIPQYANAANAANATLNALQNGQLPTAYQEAMTNSIKSSLNNSLGEAVNRLGQRGVLNSSVTNKAIYDLADRAADTVAQQYQNNIQTVGNLANQKYQNTASALGSQAGLTQQELGNANTALDKQSGLTQQQINNAMTGNSTNAQLYGGLLQSATAPITTAAAAQEAAQAPALSLWNASLGLNNAGTGALAAAAGKGTTTSTSQTQGGGLFSGLLGGLF